MKYCALFNAITNWLALVAMSIHFWLIGDTTVSILMFVFSLWWPKIVYCGSMNYFKYGNIDGKQ